MLVGSSRRRHWPGPWPRLRVPTSIPIFADQLHGYGIYEAREYNAWLAKIACGRLGSGLTDVAAGSGITR